MKLLVSSFRLFFTPQLPNGATISEFIWQLVHRKSQHRKKLRRLSLLRKTAENFVTWTEDFEQFPESFSWAEWLLFLHPEQKKLSCQDFSGTARLRGVSGSGKTCVVVHRARYLANKYSQPVMLVTLTESMRNLLEELVRELCGSKNI